MISYEVKANGKTLKRGKVSLDVAPQQAAELDVPVSGLKPKADTEYFVNFAVTTVQPEEGVPAGHEIAHEQFRLPIEPLPVKLATAGSPLEVKTVGDELIASSGKVTFVFNKKTGVATSYKVNGANISRTVLASSPTSGVLPMTTTTVTVLPSVSKCGNSPARISMWLSLPLRWTARMP